MADAISPARIATLAVLEKLRKTAKDNASDIPLPVLLDEQCRRLKLDSRDAGLTTELVCGVLRTESRLQLVLRPFVRKPDSLPAGMRELLLMAAYELLKLDAIPARATLHQTVSLARKRFGAGMSGLANAVLRAVHKTVESGEAQSVFAVALQNRNAENPAQALAVAASLPLWLAEMWWTQYGDAAWGLADNATQRPLPSYRINARLAAESADSLRQKLTELGGTAHGAYGFLFPETTDKTLQAERGKVLAEAEAAGQISRQGLGSQSVIEEVAAFIHQSSLSLAPVWDACCGRGGKTCGLQEQGINVQLASDPSAERLDALRHNLQRLHLPSPRLENSDIATLRQTLSHTTPSFPVILIDAPCSGTGTLARNPELRLRLSLERLAEAVRLQASILDDAWACLADGGLLFYATCALNKAENEEQIDALTTRHPDTQVLQQGLRFIGTPAAPGGHDALFLAVVRKTPSKG